MLFVEWYRFGGADTSQWPTSNWIMLLFVILGEAFASAVIAVAVDRALPAVGGRAVPKSRRKHSRRGSQRYSAR